MDTPEAHSTSGPAPERSNPGPLLINLAAGMAIEVDGVLDLRGHSLVDGRDRLKESVLDGMHLGWRTLHVLLGPSEVLKQGFLAFLVSPSARAISRYAQAPVPMGGPNAWILYYYTTGSAARTLEVP